MLAALAVNLSVSMQRYSALTWLSYATHWTMLFVIASMRLSIHVARISQHAGAPAAPPRAVRLWLACWGVGTTASLLICLGFWVRVFWARHSPFLAPALAA